MSVNLKDPRQKLLVERGYIYLGGAVWIHRNIKYEDGSGIKEWTLHEAYMYEEHGVWVK